MTRRKIAVIGSGVSGITAGYVLSHTDDVTLFEADGRLGGHADTHLVVPPAGPPIGVDTGFIVYNERTYPLLTRLFAELAVATQPSRMSMSVRCAGCGLQYAGQRGLAGLAAGLPRGRGRYLHMLTEVPRFHRAARRRLDQPDPVGQTLADFLRTSGFSAYFTAHFALPLVAAAWSCPDHAEVRDAAGETHRFDAVVIATHPDQALRLLDPPGPGPGRDRRSLRPAGPLLPAHPGPQHGLLMRVLGWRPRSGRGPARQAGPDLPQARTPARPAATRHGLRLGFADHHAACARVGVTGVTLSREQGGFVRQRARGLGLAHADIRIQDYRDPLDAPTPDGRYDAIASVEMGEHVGDAHYPAFCAALYQKLRPGGRLLIQQMSRTSRAGGGPFIESYIAPDMDMRPAGDTMKLIEDAGFEVIGVEAMREHYARTIRAWLDRFEQNLPAVEQILTPEQVRVWRLYLAGGALAFEEGRMGVDQILAVKPKEPAA
jgi:cyclopropane fatty-acyl-phospholipid synthase-like methyltransferase